MPQKTTKNSILLLPKTCKVQWLAFVHLASRLASSPLAPPTSSQNRRRRGRHGVDEGGGPGVAAEESQGVGWSDLAKLAKSFSKRGMTFLHM